MSAPPPDPHGIARSIQRFGSPWKLTVLAYLLERPLRFNEILRMGERDGLNARTLSRTLKALVDRGLVTREILETQSLAVQYSITEMGARLGHLLAAFADLEADPGLRDLEL